MLKQKVSLSTLIDGKEITDREVSRYMSLILQLRDLLMNTIMEFEEELKVAGLCKFEIAKNLNIIYNKVKNLPICDFREFKRDEIIAFGADGEFLENFIKKMWGFQKKKRYITTEIGHNMGDKVWTIYDNEPVQCEVKQVVIYTIIPDTGYKDIEDKSYYLLKVLDKDIVLQRGEENIYDEKEKIVIGG